MSVLFELAMSKQKEKTFPLNISFICSSYTLLFVFLHLERNRTEQEQQQR